MRTGTLRLPLILALAASLTIAACGGDDDDAATGRDTSTTEEATTTTEDDADDETGDETTGDVPGAEADPTAFLLDDKAILLGGFFGVRIPEGWAVSTAVPPVTSASPAGGETEVDPDAIEQLLVIGPEADPQAATFALLHYSHSDSVPGLVEFAEGVKGLLSADGTMFTEAQSASIGGQEALLHQLQQPDGDNGVFVTLTTGSEYFFILSIVSDDVHAGDAADLITSISIEPAAIG